MPLKSSRSITALSCSCMAALSLALTTPAGGDQISHGSGKKGIDSVERQGTKIFVYETSPSVHTAIVENQNPMVKRHVAAQEMAGQIPARKPASNEIFRTAPKRQPQDPIYVSLAPPVLDGKMHQEEKSKGAVAQHLRNGFASDPIIRLVERNQNGAWQSKIRPIPSIADVDVSSKVSIKEVSGVSGQSGQSGKRVEIVFEATITSRVPPASYTVSESGLLMNKAAVATRFVKQVKEVIVGKIGPGIPAN